MGQRPGWVPPPVYAVQIEEVRSGDDLIVLVNLGVDNLHKRVRVRLAGVDTPDAYKVAAQTEAGQLRDTVRRLVRGTCFIKVRRQTSASWLVELLVVPAGAAPEDPMNLLNVNTWLIERGYGFPHPGP